MGEHNATHESGEGTLGVAAVDLGRPRAAGEGSRAGRPVLRELSSPFSLTTQKRLWGSGSGEMIVSVFQKILLPTHPVPVGWLEGMRLSDGERGWFPVQQVEFISNPEIRSQNLKEAQRVKMAKLQLVEEQT